jgi:RNA polymerase sigma-70 factor (ECF subfamily)
VLKSSSAEDKQQLSELIEGCLRENPICQRRLYNLLSGMVMGIALRYGANQADDIFQESMIKIFKSLHKVSDLDTFFGWAKKITINLSIDHLKASKKQKFVEQLTETESYIESDFDAFSSLSNQELLDAIAALPDGYRLIFNMYEIEGYSHKEIAEKLDISVGTSKSQLYKAKLTLKSLIKRSLPSVVILFFILFHFTF